MARSEQAFIDLCKKQIEEKFSFGNGNGYTQRDLEILSNRIEEKTGVNISLSTLKRLWKNNFKQSPQIATLNALASILEHEDWQAFKIANADNPKKSYANLKWILPLSSMMIGLILILISSREREDANNQNAQDKSSGAIMVTGPVEFSTRKTITSGIPNTVIFNYDLSRVTADSFFIQQSWNDHQKVAIDPQGKTHTSIYYESGFHRARLLANDSLIAMEPIHILSDGWEPHIYYSYKDQPIDFKNQQFIKNGCLHLDSALLESRNLDFNKEFFTRITYSQQFDLSSDNFSFKARVKLDSTRNSLCPWINIIIVTEVHIFSVGLRKKGCEKYAGYKIGEIDKWGGGHDLSKLGSNLFNWQNLEVNVKDKKAEIVLNGKLAYEESFIKNFGKIVGLIYIFDGTGSIDYTQLTDETDNVVFEDDFIQ